MERVESGLAFGTSQTPLAVNPSRLPSKIGAGRASTSRLSVNDHDSFYLAGEAGELSFGAKHERLSRKNVNPSEGLEVGILAATSGYGAGTSNRLARVVARTRVGRGSWRRLRICCWARLPRPYGLG